MKKDEPCPESKNKYAVFQNTFCLTQKITRKKENCFSAQSLSKHDGICSPQKGQCTTCWPVSYTPPVKSPRGGQRVYRTCVDVLRPAEQEHDEAAFSL